MSKVEEVIFMFYYFFKVFANDGMPQLICDNCRIQTKKSYTFKQICKQSDDALKLYLATGVLKRGNLEVEVFFLY